MKTKLQNSIKRVFAVMTLMMVMLSAMPVFASDTEFNSVNITVDLQKNGNAIITEKWDVDVYDGTEMYIVKDNLGDIVISNLKVWDGDVEYETLDYWDVDAGFDEKAYKCGINPNGSAMELCYGKSEYGHHVYTVQYEMSNFVNFYTDGVYGFNQRLINDQLTDAPSQASITFLCQGYPLNEENSQIWAFGFNGKIAFEGENIVANAEDTLNSNEHMTVLCSFKDGYFTTDCYNHSDSFENVKARAMDGSDYDEDYEEKDRSIFQIIFDAIGGLIAALSSFLFMIIPFSIVFVAAALGNKDPVEKIDLTAMQYHRKVPLDMDIATIYYLYTKVGKKIKDEDLIGTYFLKWTQEKIIELRETEVTSTSAFGRLKTKKNIEIRFTGEEPVNIDEKTLFSYVKNASGHDNILQEDEFYNWSKSYYTRLRSWQKGLASSGKTTALNTGLVEMQSKNILFFKREVAMMTNKGKENAVQIEAFKRYLLDFTIINERKPVEVELWNDYLVFATLMGIADEVSSSFNDLYPTFYEENYGGYNSYMGNYMIIRTMSSAAGRGITSAEQAARSSGSGGSSSFGGGGGSSGGGSGGGSR